MYGKPAIFVFLPFYVVLFYIFWGVMQYHVLFLNKMLSILEELTQAISEGRDDIIDIEEAVAQEVCNGNIDPMFYELPIESIQRILKLCEDCKTETLTEIVKEFVFRRGENALVLLKTLNVSNLSLTEIFDLLIFFDCDVFKQLKEKYENDSALPEKDYRPGEILWFSSKGLIRDIEAMVKKGFSLEVSDKRGDKPLHRAIDGNHLNVVKYLLDNGAEIEGSGINDGKPIHTAAKIKNTEILKYLISKGANLNSRSRSKRTALHIAAESGNIEAVKVLIASGADIDVITDEGATPLHLAVAYRHHDVVRFLLEQGADKYAKNKHETTPFDIAKNNNDKVCMELLSK